VLDLMKRYAALAAAVAAVAVLAVLPFGLSNYLITLFIVLFANVALATAWSFFSGATRYISLATAAFMGVGMYVVAITHTAVPVAVALGIAALVGFLIAVVVGLSTLRLSGVYFVIFTFGLTELIHQLVIWWEINQNRRMSRYIFVDFSNTAIYELLLALSVIAITGTWYVARTRLGYALRTIGEDETVARHAGIDTTRIKVLIFAASGAMMSLVGAVLSLRYPYVDPHIAFNNVWSFQVLIAALLGGAGAFGPTLGAIPLVLLSEFLAGTFPHHFSVALGLCFVVIVYFLPGGVSAVALSWWQRATSRMRPAPKHDSAVAVLPEKNPQPSSSAPPAALGGAQLKLAPGQGLLEVQGLCKSFGGLAAVQNLSLSVAEGAIVGLIGPNGSGKTTVVNLLTGGLTADRGSALFQGGEILGERSFQICRTRVARTFQLVRILDGMTTRENIMIGGMFGSAPTTPALAGREADALLERVGLAGKGGLFGSQLTYIDQKRVELARALSTRPALLLLDEWLAGLNPTELQIGIELIEKIRRDGVTVVMVEHVMEAIRALCDHVYVMNAGELIAQGTPEQVLSEARVLQVYLGTSDVAA
jgi:branched-chain amino acid transport system permease protein